MRGQFRGYRKEKGVAPDSQVETFAALRLEVEFLALARRSVLHPGGQVPAGDLHGGPRPAPPAARRCISDFDLSRITCRFRISPDVIDRHRRKCHGTEAGDCQPDRTELIATRQPRAGRDGRLRTGAGRRHGRETPPCLPAKTMSKRHGESSIRC